MAGFLAEKRFERAWMDVCLRVGPRLRAASPGPLGELAPMDANMAGQVAASLAFEKLGMSLQDAVSFGEPLMVMITAAIRGLPDLQHQARTELLAAASALEQKYGAAKVALLDKAVGRLVVQLRASGAFAANRSLDQMLHRAPGSNDVVLPAPPPPPL
jgi:hypothetical protein